MDTILIIEDDKNIRSELSTLLKSNGYKCILIEDFTKEIAIPKETNLILLDITLPNENGFNICSKIRKSSQIPIIFVTSSEKDKDELKSIIVGGDDFITKPYNKYILLGKIKRALSKIQNNKNEITIKNVTFNIPSSTLIYQNKIIELTRNERKIIYYFFTNPNKIITKDELIEYLWNDKYYLDENILTVNINRLRKKLEEINQKDFIVTERGKGYKI